MAFNPAPKAVQENHHVDYVIRFNYGDIDTPEAIKKFEVLLLELSEVGLQTEVRQGDENSLFVFVRAASKKKLKRAVYQSRYVALCFRESQMSYANCLWFQAFETGCTASGIPNLSRRALRSRSQKPSGSVLSTI